MMEYMIVTGQYASDVEIEVGKYLAMGWKPQGGVSVTRSNSHGHIREKFAQAMIRESAAEVRATIYVGAG